MKNKSADKSLVRSVSRALGILEVIAREECPLGLVAISRLVGLDPTTTHRLLHTMEEQNFVIQNPTDGKYSLGVRAFQIGNSVTHVTILRQIARPFLQVLMTRTGETANLAIKNGAEATYIEQVPGPHFLRTFNEVGRGVPLHATAVGKALMMDSGENELRRIATARLKRCTHNTLTTYEGLVAEIHRCKEQGYAIDLEEFEIGANCVGAPVLGSNGKVICAVSVSGPTSRLPQERIRAIVPIIMNSVAELSQALKCSNTPIS